MQLRNLALYLSCGMTERLHFLVIAAATYSCAWMQWQYYVLLSHHSGGYKYMEGIGNLVGTSPTDRIIRADRLKEVTTM